MILFDDNATQNLKLKICNSVLTWLTAKAYSLSNKIKYRPPQAEDWYLRSIMSIQVIHSLGPLYSILMSNKYIKKYI